MKAVSKHKCLVLIFMYPSPSENAVPRKQISEKNQTHSRFNQGLNPTIACKSHIVRVFRIVLRNFRNLQTNLFDETNERRINRT